MQLFALELVLAAAAGVRPPVARAAVPPVNETEC